MIGIKELLIEDLRFHLYQYKDGIIETNELCDLVLEDKEFKLVNCDISEDA